MNLVFISSTTFGLHCLESIVVLPGIDVKGIITSQENFSISYRPSGVHNVLHTDFQKISAKHNIPIFCMKNKMTDPCLVEIIKKWNPDFILVAGWYHMIPKVIRDIAPTAGLHASLLPEYSGGAPLVWAIINGETQTGITFFLMDDGVDSGPIIGQLEEPIFWEDTIATLYGRIEERGIELIREYLPKIAQGSVTYTQQDHSKRQIMPQRSPEDGQIDLEWPSERIYHFIRAQTSPYPGAFVHINNKNLYLWNATIIDDCVLKKDITNSEIISYSESSRSIIIRCKDKRIVRVSEYTLI